MPSTRASPPSGACESEKCSSTYTTGYPELLFLGRDYPQGYGWFRPRLHKAFMAKADLTDEDEIKRGIAHADFVRKGTVRQRRNESPQDSIASLTRFEPTQQRSRHCKSHRWCPVCRQKECPRFYHLRDIQEQLHHPRHFPPTLPTYIQSTPNHPITHTPPVPHPSSPLTVCSRLTTMNVPPDTTSNDTGL